MENLERYAPELFCSTLERDFYAKVNVNARLEHLLADEAFWLNSGEHIGMFTDHGIVHARDVARQVISVLKTANGVLIPSRDPARLEFMIGYGVLLAFLHDIGMSDRLTAGRAMHPEFAAQYVFQPAFDALLDNLWQDNPGSVVARLSHLAGSGDLPQPPRDVLREMLALSCCHSKSKIPITLLNDPEALRRKILQIVGTGINRLRVEQEVERCLEQMDNGHAQAQADLETASALLSQIDEDPTARHNLKRLYAYPDQEAYRWLTCESTPVYEMVADVVDTLRCLRCADALRQRGTVLKTSGSYEIMVNQVTANAIYAMRLGDDQLYMLEVSHPLPSGEANLSGSELQADGNLRIAFHRGAFASAEVVERAAAHAAYVVNDIQADVIDSFRCANIDGTLERADEIMILLEGTEDHLGFPEKVITALLTLNPRLARQVRAVPSMHSLAPGERSRYLDAPADGWDALAKSELLTRMDRAGHNVDGMELDKAFEHVRLGQIRAGEILIEAGSPPGFVYVPLGEGLKVIPLGGYEAFAVRAWMPLGNTGVIRGAIRNATVACESDLDVVIIPKEIFLRWWHRPLSLDQLAARVRDTSQR